MLAKGLPPYSDSAANAAFTPGRYRTNAGHCFKSIPSTDVHRNTVNKYASATRSLAEDAGLQLRDVRVEVREWSSAFTLVRENIGVTLVPEMTLPSQLQGLRVVPVKPRIDREFALVAATNKPPSAAVQALMGMLAKK